MMMPSKIWAGHNGYGTYWQTDVSDKDTPYIRADISEELARALEACPGSIVRKALSRYREALAD